MNQFFCPFCGAQILDGDTFCPGCGNSLAEYAAPDGKKKKKGKGKKRPLIAIVVVLAVAVIAGGVFAALKFTSFSAAPQPFPISQPAYVDPEGDAYLVEKGGKLLELDGEVYAARMSADQDYIIVLETDGTLSLEKNGERTEIAEDVYYFMYSDKGIKYYSVRNEDGHYRTPEEDRWEPTPYKYEYYLYWIDSGITVDLENFYYNDFYTGSFSYSGEYFVYLIEDGDDYTLCALENGSDTPVEIDTRDVVMDICGISDNTGTVIYTYTEPNSDEQKYMMYVDGETEKAFSCQYSGYTTFNKAGDFCVINSFGDTMGIWAKKGDVETVRFSGSSLDYTIYTDTGIFNQRSEETPSCIYLSARTDSAEDLYAITTDGDKDKLVSDIDEYSISNHTLYYTKDGTLRCASIKNGELGEDEKIAKKVEYFSTAPDGAVAYACEKDDAYALYYYSPKAKEPVLVCDDVYEFHFTTDGKAIYYLKSPESTYDTMTGTMMRYDIRKDDSEKIARNARFDQVFSFSYAYSLIDDRDFSFIVFDDVDDDTAYWDIVHWNGRETNTLLKNYIY